MKLSWALIASSCQGKKIYGCDPAELGHYDMIEDGCKRFKGMNTELGNVEGYMGKVTEKKSNWCRRQCKYGDLPQTVQTMCKCKKINGKFECWYQIKLQKTVKGFVAFNYTDTDGNYPLDKWGEGGHQPGCVLPSDKGEWGAWGAWSECDGECGLGKRTRTRPCSSQWCGDDDTEEMECVKYADTNAYHSGHPCNSGNNWLFKGTSADDDYECTLRGDGGCEYYNDGHYCVMPSHGGWPMGDAQFGDENVTMGIECEGDEVYPFDSYVITGLNAKCKVVCKGDKGGLYMPETLFWHKFQCLTPIPIQLTRETNCYTDKWNGHANLEGECLLDWQEKGLGLRTVSQGYVNWPEQPVPWYFNTQNWPHASCVGGCGTHRNLQETHEVVNKCYKIEGTEYPTCGGKPPRTQAEKDAGTAGSEVKWNCDDGWNAGSICQKSCDNPSHIMTSGNPRMICHCSETDGAFGCDWKITQENPNPSYSTQISYTDSADCIGACNANSKSWGDNSDDEYTVNCDDIGSVPDWSSDVFPINAGKKCRVHCKYDVDKDYWYIGLYPREWMLTNFYETGTNTFELTCQKTESGNYELTGDFTKCEHVCTPMGVLKGDENHPDLNAYGTPDVFECTDGWRIGSTCTKVCPEGQSLQGGGKTSKQCKKGGYGGWSSNYASFKACKPN